MRKHYYVARQKEMQIRGWFSNISCITAHQQGLGTVIVGAFDHDKTREILGVPSTHEVVALLPIGYPDHEPPAPKRKSMEEFVHWDSFGNN